MKKATTKLSTQGGVLVTALRGGNPKLGRFYIKRTNLRPVLVSRAKTIIKTSTPSPFAGVDGLGFNGVALVPKGWGRSVRKSRTMHSKALTMAEQLLFTHRRNVPLLILREITKRCLFFLVNARRVAGKNLAYWIRRVDDHVRTAGGPLFSLDHCLRDQAYNRIAALYAGATLVAQCGGSREWLDVVYNPGEFTNINFKINIRKYKHAFERKIYNKRDFIGKFGLEPEGVLKICQRRCPPQSKMGIILARSFVMPFNFEREVRRARSSALPKCVGVRKLRYPTHLARFDSPARSSRLRVFKKPLNKVGATDPSSQTVCVGAVGKTAGIPTNQGVKIDQKKALRAGYPQPGVGSVTGVGGVIKLTTTRAKPEKTVTAGAGSDAGLGQTGGARASNNTSTPQIKQVRRTTQSEVTRVGAAVPAQPKVRDGFGKLATISPKQGPRTDQKQSTNVGVQLTFGGSVTGVGGAAGIPPIRIKPEKVAGPKPVTKGARSDAGSSQIRTNPVSNKTRAPQIKLVGQATRSEAGRIGTVVPTHPNVRGGGVKLIRPAIGGGSKPSQAIGGKRQSAPKRLVWGKGTILIGVRPTKKQRVSARRLPAWVSVPNKSAIVSRVIVQPPHSHLNARKQPIQVNRKMTGAWLGGRGGSDNCANTVQRPGVPVRVGHVKLKKIKMWTRKWVWTKTARLTHFERLIKTDKTPTSRQLRLSVLKAKTRVKLVHTNLLWLAKYRSLLKRPPFIRTRIRARIKRARKLPVKKGIKTPPTQAWKRYTRMLKFVPYTYMLWWRYLGTLTPQALELARYKMHFKPRTTYRLPRFGLRVDRAYLRRGSPSIIAYGPKQYTSARWTPTYTPVSDRVLDILWMEDERGAQGLGVKTNQRTLPHATKSVVRSNLATRATRALRFPWRRRVGILPTGATLKNPRGIDALVCMWYCNLIEGLLGVNWYYEPYRGGVLRIGRNRECVVQVSSPRHSRGSIKQTENALMGALTNFKLCRQRYTRAKPFLWLGGTSLIRDLEHYLGTSIYLILDHLSIQNESANFYILRYCFFIKFGWIGRFFVIPLHEAYLSSYYSMVCHDLDLLCQFFQEVLSSSYYAQAPKLFTIYSQMLCYTWPMSVRYGAGVGLFFELKGKFHRYMTIESQSKRLRLGKTTHSTTNYSLAFRYRQGVNETGAFGIHIHLLSKNEIKDFSNAI